MCTWSGSLRVRTVSSEASEVRAGGSHRPQPITQGKVNGNIVHVYL